MERSSNYLNDDVLDVSAPATSAPSAAPALLGCHEPAALDTDATLGPAAPGVAIASPSSVRLADTYTEKEETDPVSIGAAPLSETASPDTRCKDHTTGPAADPFRVVFARNDPRDPKRWHIFRKWQVLGVTLLLQVWANTISATYAPGMSYVAHDFHISPAAARVVQTIYLYGFACGPVISAPLSEDFGRLPVLLAGGTGMGLMQLHCALSPNYGSLLAARFLSGFFAASTFNSVGTVADLFIPEEQGWGVNSFGFAAEIGVVIASLYSGFLVQRTQTWRWLFGVTGIVTGFLVALALLTVPETNPGVLLSRRARKLRKKTGDDRYYSDHDRARSQRSRMDTFREVIVRPAHMLLTEPIVSAFAAFDGYNYSILYLCLEAAPLIYANQHGFSLPYQGYALAAMGVGFLLAYATYPISQSFVRRAQRRSPTGEVEPEALLQWGLFVAPFFPASLFWFAWTIQSSIPWIVSMLALAVFGYSSHVIFIFVSDYTVGAYGHYAASAVAGQSLAREIISGTASLIAEPMFNNLPSYEWAACLLAFIALPLALIPLILYRAGPWLRTHSPFAKQIALAARQDALHSPSPTLHA